MSSALAGASPSLHVAWVLRPFDLFPAEGWGWPSGLIIFLRRLPWPF